VAKAFLTDVVFAVQRVTDEHTPEDLEVVKPRELGAGEYVFGAVVHGAFIPLQTLKGGGVDKKIAQAQAAAAERAALAKKQADEAAAAAAAEQAAGEQGNQPPPPPAA
jgi:hypothetical protein